MQLKFKNVSKNEKYASSISAMKSYFKNEENVFVSFGYLGKSFSFDSSEKTNKNILGEVIASASFNNRDEYKGDYHISFYVIHNSLFDYNYQQKFQEECLPQIWQWYQDMKCLPVTYPSGVEVLCIEWNKKDFIVHHHRFS